MTNIHPINIVIELKIGVVLINSIISEMHTQIIHVISIGLLVGFCRKTCQPFIINKNPERITACKKYIDSKVEFETVNQKRFMQVALNNIMVSWINIIQISS